MNRKFVLCLYLASIACCYAITSLEHQPGMEVTLKNNLCKRSPFTCVQGEMDVSPEEEAIFKAYFCRQDVYFFQKYTEEYFESIYLGQPPAENFVLGIETKLQILKIVLRALKKVARAVKSIEFISVTPVKKAKQHEVIYAANYILTMWNKSLANLKESDYAAYNQCFLESDVPYKSFADFSEKLDAMRAKLSIIQNSFQ